VRKVAPRPIPASMPHHRATEHDLLSIWRKWKAPALLKYVLLMRKVHAHTAWLERNASGTRSDWEDMLTDNPLR